MSTDTNPRWRNLQQTYRRDLPHGDQDMPTAADAAKTRWALVSLDPTGEQPEWLFTLCPTATDARLLAEGDVEEMGWLPCALVDLDSRAEYRLSAPVAEWALQSASHRVGSAMPDTTTRSSKLQSLFDRYQPVECNRHVHDAADAGRPLPRWALVQFHAEREPEAMRITVFESAETACRAATEGIEWCFDSLIDLEAGVEYELPLAWPFESADARPLAATETESA